MSRGCYAKAKRFTKFPDALRGVVRRCTTWPKVSRFARFRGDTSACNFAYGFSKTTEDKEQPENKDLKLRNTCSAITSGLPASTAMMTHLLVGGVLRVLEARKLRTSIFIPSHHLRAPSPAAHHEDQRCLSNVTAKRFTRGLDSRQQRFIVLASNAKVTLKCVPV